MRLAPLGAAVLVCALALAGTAAEAKPRHHGQHIITCDMRGCSDRGTAAGPARGVRHTPASRSGDPRPSAWCGWWLRQQLGVADRLYNLARAWARYGQPAHGPAEGVIVVWRHHVGMITGRSGGQWIVKSGNDGGAVRERPRSLAGVIAFRRPNGMAEL